jgi:hypothetical protein
LSSSTGVLGAKDDCAMDCKYAKDGPPNRTAQSTAQILFFAKERQGNHSR